MHEFSLCNGILSQVAKANSAGLSAVEEITIEVGELAGVDLDSLCFWFPVVAEKQGAAHIQLKVQQQAGLAQCNACAGEFALHNFYDPCPHCGAYADYQIRAGRELLVKFYQVKRTS